MCRRPSALYVVKEQTEQGEVEVGRYCAADLPARWKGQARLLDALPTRRYGMRHSCVDTTSSITS
jgi:hypothetical protein